MQFISDRVGQLESVSLIGRFRVIERGTRSSRCEVMIDKEMVLLFAGDHYSKFVWEKYRKLSPPLAACLITLVPTANPTL
nr:hypothetical protein [Salmonella enterica subsp. enterica serovar Rissen]